MRGKNFITYVFLALAFVLLSVTTTLALIQDNESKIGGILKFDKVSICADKEGSVLSAVVDSEIGDGTPILTEENKFYVKPTDDTVDCYIRVRFYYTTTDETINEEHETTLKALTNNGNPVGLTMYTGENYGYTLHTDGWFYLVDTANDSILREVYANDNAYIITQNYSVPMDVLTVDVYSLSEAVATANAEVQLICEVYAMQCENLDGLQELENGTLAGDIILDNGIRTKKHPEVTLAQFAMAVQQNIAEIEKIPKVYLKEFKNEQTTSYIGQKGFLGTKGYESYPREYEASLCRKSIRTLKLTGEKPVLAGKEVKYTGYRIANGNYHKFDVGTEPGHIFVYWIRNGTHYDNGSTSWSSFDVIVYQEGGVCLNPNSSYLFAGVGQYAMQSVSTIDMSDWQMNTYLVTDMSYMFYSSFCHYDASNTIKFPNKFETKNVEKMDNMFNLCANNARNIYLGGFGVGKNLNKVSTKNIFTKFGWKATVDKYHTARIYTSDKKVYEWVKSKNPNNTVFSSVNLITA